MYGINTQKFICSFNEIAENSDAIKEIAKVSQSNRDDQMRFVADFLEEIYGIRFNGYAVDSDGVHFKFSD